MANRFVTPVLVHGTSLYDFTWEEIDFDNVNYCFILNFRSFIDFFYFKFCVRIVLCISAFDVVLYYLLIICEI